MSQSSTASSQPLSQEYQQKSMDHQHRNTTRSGRVFGELQSNTNAAAANTGPRKLAKHVQQQQPKRLAVPEQQPQPRSEWAAFEPKLEGWRQALKEEAADIDDQADPNEVPDYAFIAFEYFRAREGAQPVEPYLHKRKEINDRMRQVLVDWLVEIQESFQLAHETLYLAVTMTDLYMARREVSRDEMQLVGATAVLLASKFYERWPPYTDDLVFVCDEAYSREQFLETEMKLIQALDFDINLPVSYLFLRRYSKVMNFTMPQLTLARYVLELSLMEYKFIDVPASKMASATFLWSLLHFDMDWNTSLSYHTSYQKKELLEIVEQLNIVVQKAPKRKLKTIYDKYSHENFFKVAENLEPVSLEKVDTDDMEMSIIE